MKYRKKLKDADRKRRIERTHKIYGSKPEETSMEEKLLLDQPPIVEEGGTVEFVVAKPGEDILITEEPMDGVELLNG